MAKTIKKSTKKARTDKYKIATNKILRLLEQGTKPWIKPWKSYGNAKAPQNLISGHVYQGCNPILALVDMITNAWECPYFISFNQAKNHGWKIKKGSKATSILFAHQFSTEVENDNGDPETKSFFTQKWYNVFNIACLDDSDSDQKIVDFINHKLADSSAIPNNPDNPIDIAEKFINSQNADINFGLNRAFYSPSSDKIGMPDFNAFSNAPQYYATLIHELIHRTGHSSRLNRDLSGGFGSKKYAFEELVAELGSVYVCNTLLLDWNCELDNHASYLQNWLSILKEDNKAFFRASLLAQKASNYLLDRSL